MSRSLGAQSANTADVRGAWRGEAAETLRVLANGFEAMADALEQQDDILGAIAGMGLAENLPALPAHIRHTFTESLSDEAAAGLRSERLYYEALAEGMGA